jgi:tetratricopeptide (TPR) repeat protein
MQELRFHETGRNRRRGACWVLALLLHAAAASAQPVDERSTLGQELFDQGRALMEQKDYPRACKKFEESARLERAVGTLLNLALCYELQNKTRTAWAHFNEALSLARREGRLDRQRFAEEHIAALAKRMSRVRIVVPRSSRISGLTVRRNDIALTEGAWNEALSVDPGPMVVEASAPGRTPFKTTITVGPEADLKTVVIPLLDPEAPRTATPVSMRGKTHRWLAYGAGAVGLAAIGVGSFFGIRAIDRNNRAEDLCPNADRCDPSAFSISEQAVSDGRLATYFFAGGAVFLGAGGVLFVTAPSGQQGRAAVLTFRGGF